MKKKASYSDGEAPKKNSITCVNNEKLRDDSKKKRKNNQLFICINFVKHYSLCFRYAFRFGVCLLKIKNALQRHTF